MMKNKGHKQKKGIGRFENEKLHKEERLQLQSYRGVYFNNSSKEYPFRAQIQRQSVKYHLGKFKTIEEAALAYDQGATELFGNEAKLNKHRNTTVYVSFEKSIDERIRFYKKMIERLENIKANTEANREKKVEKKIKKKPIDFRRKTRDLKQVKKVDGPLSMKGAEAEIQKRYEALQERSSKEWFNQVKND